MKEIHITPVLNGFIVKVGCQTVVFTSIGALCLELQRYEKNPQDVEKEYLTSSVNSGKMQPRIQTRQVAPGIEVRVTDDGGPAIFGTPETPVTVAGVPSLGTSEIHTSNMMEPVSNSSYTGGRR